jgi:hypothetical protein
MWRFQKCCLSLTLRAVMQERLNACYSLRHTYEESRKFLLYMHSFVLSSSIKGRILISENTPFLRIIYLFEKRPCHGSGGQSLAFHSGGPCSPPESVHCDLWWTTWHLDSFLSEFFGFSLSITFHRGSPYSSIIWRMNNRPLVVAVQRQSHLIDMNNNSK